MSYEFITVEYNDEKLILPQLIKRIGNHTEHERNGDTKQIVF